MKTIKKATKTSLGIQRNKLLRYKTIVEEFNKHDANLLSITTIHKKYIYPKFFISRDTLYTILKVNIDAELQQINKLYKNA